MVEHDAYNVGVVRSNRTCCIKAGEFQDAFPSGSVPLGKYQAHRSLITPAGLKIEIEMEKASDWKLIGTGRLNWPREERVCDRYGCVVLGPDVDAAASRLPLDLPEDGGKGQIVAEVLATRQSTHIGDLFHGLRPETPNVGEMIVLGEGHAFHKADEWGEAIGLKPLAPRETFWLDPKSLYRCHDQTVNLYFVPVL